jgi:hypothetical protein
MGVKIGRAEGRVYSGTSGSGPGDSVAGAGNVGRVKIRQVWGYGYVDAVGEIKYRGLGVK